jgi:hypothetical protein
MKTFYVASAKRLSITPWSVRIAIAANCFASFAAKGMINNVRVAPTA